jgi:hypothetical protein
MEKVIELPEIIRLKRDTENKILEALNDFRRLTDLSISTIEINTININGETIEISVNTKVVF